MHWIHTSFQGRWDQASPRVVDDIFLRHSLFLLLLLLLLLFFSIYLFVARASLLLYMIRPDHLVYSVSQQEHQHQQVFRVLTKIFRRSSFCTLNPIYPTERLFFLPSSSSLGFFQKKKLILTDCFFFVGLFVRTAFFVSTAAAAVASAAVLLQVSCSDYNMYARMYEKRNEKRNMMMKDEQREREGRKKKKLRAALLWWLWLLLFLLLLMLLAKWKNMLTNRRHLSRFLLQIEHFNCYSAILILLDYRYEIFIINERASEGKSSMNSRWTNSMSRVHYSILLLHSCNMSRRRVLNKLSPFYSMNNSVLSAIFKGQGNKDQFLCLVK